MSSVEKTAVETTAKEETKKKPLTLNVDAHETLNRLIEGENMTASDLASKVNRIFRGILQDYSGSRITVDPMYKTLTLELFFEDHGTPTDGKIKNIVPLTGTPEKTRSGQSFIQAAMRMNEMQNTTKMYKLTDETKELLTPFLLGKFVMVGGIMQMVKATEKDLDATGTLVNEISIPNAQYMGQNSSRVVVVVKGLNLNAIVTKMYGSEINGTSYDYDVSPMRPIPGTNEWLVSVNRIDKKELNKLSIKAGIKNPGVTWVQA